MAPKQIRDIRQNRQAVAPYNFVELPDRVVPAPDLPKENAYDAKRRTGKIACTLTTSSPLYIRCGIAPSDYPTFADQSISVDQLEQLSPEQRNRRSAFFKNPATLRPTLPGSSLRGMLRTLVEIVGFGKIDQVADSQLIYRAVADTTALGDTYRDRLLNQVRNGEYEFLMQAGYIIQDRTGWAIRPAVEISPNTSFARIEASKIPRDLERWYSSRNAHKIAVEVSGVRPYPHNQGQVKLHYAKATPITGAEPNGILVKTGHMSRKHMEFVFGLPNSNSESAIKIPAEMVQDYREQITDGQETLLGEAAALQNWQPVFYVLDEAGKLVFFGHAMMFRLPYENSVKQFIPADLRSADQADASDVVDLAEAIFGYVRDQKRNRDQSRSGRVFVTDAVCSTSSSDIWVTDDEDTAISPKILGSPKPTTFQHYLVQPKETEAEEKQLKHYASRPVHDTVLRGHKLYWHHGNISLDHVQANRLKVIQAKKQYTEIKPIKAGVSFEFTIYFENLNQVELGALLWVLQTAQDEKYRLSLGMGKPLGMGAVKITHTVNINDRSTRYSNLFGEDKNWETGYSAPLIREQELEYIDAFERHVLHTVQSRQTFQELRRIRMLLAMLTWKDRLTPDELNQRRYMEIERDVRERDVREIHIIGDPRPKDRKHNEYKKRHVLPTPLQVIGEEGDQVGNGNGNNPRNNDPRQGGSSGSRHSNRGSSGGSGSSETSNSALRRGPRPPKPTGH